MDRKAFASATGVSRETLDAYQLWQDTLVRWSKHTNLVSRHTLDQFWERHAYDSWRLAELIPHDRHRMVDLGSGAGFPAIALALAFRDRGQDCPITMVDSVGKKVTFLREVIRALDLQADARSVRVETLDPAEGFDLVTARAFAPLNKLLGFAAPLLKNGAIGVFPKGRMYEDELTEARKNWTFDVEVIPSQTGDGVVLKLAQVRRCSSKGTNR